MLWDELALDLVPKLLVTAITSTGVLFLLPVKLNVLEGRDDPWSISGLRAVEVAEQAWARIVPNMTLGGYETYEAQGDLPEPKFPDSPFKAILATAFRDRHIDTLDHPVVRKLRGLQK
jgi:hypothetical protein